MASISLSSIVGQPRRRTFTLTSSNAALVIPSWAQGGKGIVYVTGGGGGGSGGISTLSTNYDYGCGGGSAGYAVRAPMRIPSGVATLSALVGSAGSAVSATYSEATGIAGGNTSVAISGEATLFLSGGTGGGVTYVGSGGQAQFGSAFLTDFASNQGPFFKVGSVSVGYGAASAFLCYGSDGLGRSGSVPVGGGHSQFGRGGLGMEVVISSTSRPGNNAVGYCAGGSGASTGGTGTATLSGAGTPGILFLEFVEGF